MMLPCASPRDMPKEYLSKRDRARAEWQRVS